LTPNQKAALDNARNPSAANPLATVADVPPIRLVAAGNLDLSRVSPPTTPGRLGVIAADPSRGLATLSFLNFEASRRERYVVKALPINARAGQQREMIVVQFVEFTAGGFTLHMADVPNKKPALGLCMVEVCEMG
jgi:hypothetical protein